ncbi:MAG: DUF2726 domain-containing protein [Anaerolineales bacterium]|nr:DUF2726 domain-containing protein [Anaerolineales bacterium]
MEDITPYRLREPFLSSAETAFLDALRVMVEDRFLINIKVALPALFHVVRPNEKVHFYSKIFRKNIDFLLIDPTTYRPAIGIELLHAMSKREERESDRFLSTVFEAARIPLVRVPLAGRYDVNDLLPLFHEAIIKAKNGNSYNKVSSGESVPLCPKCGLMMVLRINRNGSNGGKQYYGCMNSPACDGVVEIS